MSPPEMQVVQLGFVVFSRGELAVSSSIERLRDGRVREAYTKGDVLGPDGIPVDAVAKVVGWGTSVSREML